MDYAVWRTSDQLGITSFVGPRFAVLRKAVGQPDPLELTGCARVILRRHLFGIIKTACRDVDLARRVIVLKSQLGATVSAEAPHALWG